MDGSEGAPEASPPSALSLAGVMSTNVHPSEWI